MGFSAAPPCGRGGGLCRCIGCLIPRAVTTMTETRRIPMHRRTCTVSPGRIDISPSRNSIVWPLVGLMVGGLCFVAIVFGLGTLPFPLVILLLLVGVVIVPLSGMGLVYSFVGGNVAAG